MPPRSSRTAPKLPPYETDVDNVVRQEQAKGTVRPDGPGDATAPIETESQAHRSTRSTPRKRGIPLKPSSKITRAEKASRGQLPTAERAATNTRGSTKGRASANRGSTKKPAPPNARASSKGRGTPAGRAPATSRTTRAKRPAR